MFENQSNKIDKICKILSFNKNKNVILSNIYNYNCQKERPEKLLYINNE